MQSAGECVTLSKECVNANIWRAVPEWSTMRDKVKIYNWDGRKYRLLGRVRLHRVNGTHVVNLPEWFGDRSFTTSYLLYVSERFSKKHRYENLLFRAGKTRYGCLLRKGCARRRCFPTAAEAVGVCCRSGEGTHDHNQCMYDREK